MKKLNTLKLESLIKRARQYQINAEKAELAIFEYLYSIGIVDPSLFESEAENAENLEQAITCYLSYGEFSISDLLLEIQSAYEEVTKNDR